MTLIIKLYFLKKIGYSTSVGRCGVSVTFRITPCGFPKLRGWGTTSLRSPTWWGSNLGGGRQAGSRELVSYARPLGPSIGGGAIVPHTSAELLIERILF